MEGLELALQTGPVVLINGSIGQQIRAAPDEIYHMVEVRERILEDHEIGLHLLIPYVALDLVKPTVVEELGQCVQRFQLAHQFPQIVDSHLAYLPLSSCPRPRDARTASGNSGHAWPSSRLPSSVHMSLSVARSPDLIQSKFHASLRWSGESGRRSIAVPHNV